VDRDTKPIHIAQMSATNIQDRAALPPLLHDSETRVRGVQGYQGRIDEVKNGKMR